jgi:hypothetical protein
MIPHTRLVLKSLTDLPDLATSTGVLGRKCFSSAGHAAWRRVWGRYSAGPVRAEASNAPASEDLKGKCAFFLFFSFSLLFHEWNPCVCTRVCLSDVSQENGRSTIPLVGHLRMCVLASSRVCEDFSLWCCVGLPRPSVVLGGRSSCVRRSVSVGLVPELVSIFIHSFISLNAHGGRTLLEMRVVSTSTFGRPRRAQTL